MDWQHFMASAGVVVPEQSKTYATSAVATNTTRISRPTRIDSRLSAKLIQVKGTVGRRSGLPTLVTRTAARNPWERVPSHSACRHSPP